MDTKTCSGCGIEYPLSSEWFVSDKSHKDKFRSRCKICENEARRKRYVSCQNQNRAKKYYESHKEQHAKYTTNWKKCHPEAMKKQSLNYRTKNKETELVRHLAYRKQHKQELREKSSKYYYLNKDKCSAASLRWERENRTTCNVNNQKYRSAKRGLEWSLTREEWESAKECFENRCAYCGKEKHLSQDHFVPVSSGGSFVKENIIPSCRSCNSSKANKNFFDWYPKNQNYSPEREQKIVQYIGINKTGCITLPAYG